MIDVNTLFGPLPDASADLAVDALLKMMQRRGVSTACTLSTIGILLDTAMGNTATRAACAEHKVLAPVATLNPMLYFGDDKGILSLRDEGFCMVRFFPELQGWPIEYAPFRALVEALKPTGLPIMVDVSGPGSITALQDILGDFPSAVILAGADVSLLAEVIAALRRYPQWVIETSRLHAVGATALVIERTGPDRVLFGSGSPSRPISSAIQTLRCAGLAEDVLTKIADSNARRVLNLA